MLLFSLLIRKPSLNGSIRSAERLGKGQRSAVITLVSLVIIGILSVFSIYQYALISSANNKLEANEKRIDFQKEQLEEARQSKLSQSFSEILKKIENETSKDATSLISDNTLARLKYLCSVTNPYSPAAEPSLLFDRVSPEKGQLLVGLIRSKINSLSWQKIKSEVSFSGCFLEEIDLSGMDLSSIDLSGSSLRGANLEGVNLSNARLLGVNFTQANMAKSILVGSQMKRAIFSNAILNNANLSNANLNGANLAYIVALSADFHASSIQYASMEGALLQGSNLSDCSFQNLNLDGTSFLNSDLRGTLMGELDLSETILTGTKINTDWIRLYSIRHLEGVEKILLEYQIKPRGTSDTLLIKK